MQQDFIHETVGLGPKPLRFELIPEKPKAPLGGTINSLTYCKPIFNMTHGQIL